MQQIAKPVPSEVKYLAEGASVQKLLQAFASNCFLSRAY
ncbi:MAG: hypothetical protein JWO71_4330 [Candidatus Acidoferrum typicum]|nr:hypothetical protein [Candidatus Acidoferrum typicum]